MFDINEKVRRMALDHPVPYRVWAARHKKNLPQSGDALYLDGYPRSGNTYFTAFVRRLDPEIAFANHLHCVAPIKIALNLGIPTFILMRNPEDTVLSYMVHLERFGRKSRRPNANPRRHAERLLNNWLRYYRFVDGHREHLKVILSDEAFKEPIRTVERILEIAGVSRGPRFADKLKKIHTEFVTRDASKAQGSTSYPSAERERMKNSYRECLEESNGLTKARQLYLEMVSRV